MEIHREESFSRKALWQFSTLSTGSITVTTNISQSNLKFFLGCLDNGVHFTNASGGFKVSERVTAMTGQKERT